MAPVYLLPGIGNRPGPLPDRSFWQDGYEYAGAYLSAGTYWPAIGRAN